MDKRATCSGAAVVREVKTITSDAIKNRLAFEDGDLFGVVMADLCQYGVFLRAMTWPVAIWQETQQCWYGNRSSNTLSHLLEVFPRAIMVEPERLLDIAERGVGVLVSEKMEGAINGK